jgi:hypothetical protein
VGSNPACGFTVDYWDRLTTEAHRAVRVVFSIVTFYFSRENLKMKNSKCSSGHELSTGFARFFRNRPKKILIKAKTVHPVILKHDFLKQIFSASF